MMTKKIKLMVVEEMVIKMTMMIRNRYLNKSNADPRKKLTGKGVRVDLCNHLLRL